MYFPRIEDLRIDSDRKQYEVAAYLHLNREVYRRYEKGEREIPVWAVIRRWRVSGTLLTMPPFAYVLISGVAV